jgi:hypothetical protein
VAAVCDPLGVAAVRVYLEVGSKRVFACARDWPGWCRAGRTEADALAALAAYAPRYAAVAADAGASFPMGAPTLEVVERVPGSAGTDFGAPGAVPPGDAAPPRPGEGERLASLVEAAWRAFEGVVAGAPAELRKGPRGGGRDRDKIVEHVVDAEVAYSRKLGLRGPRPKPGDRAAVRAMREEILARLRDGGPPSEGGWPARYAARRIAWHVLDHAWEIEDRARPGEVAG